MNSSISADKTPNGVFRRVDSNDVEAPDLFFIIKQYKITFGNSPVRDIRIKSSACPATIAVVRNTYNQSWIITNESAYHALVVNETFVRNKGSISLKSGDKIRFNFADANLDLTYSFHIYSEDNPPTSFEMKSYLEPILKTLAGKADAVYHTCSELISELNKLTNIQNNTEVIYPNGRITSICRVPMGSFKQITSNVVAPVFYFFDKFITTFGKSTVCDIVIKSDECSPVEATVRKTNKWRITNDGKQLLFINNRYFENGETLNLKSGDQIRFGGNLKFNLKYEFQVYFNEAFPTKIEAKKFLETEYNKLQGKVSEIKQSCHKLKTRLESLNENIESEPPVAHYQTVSKDETKNGRKRASNFDSFGNNCSGVNNLQNTAAIIEKTGINSDSSKLKIESDESKAIENKLINNYGETLVVECEEVDSNHVKRNTEPVEVSKIESKPPAAYNIMSKDETQNERKRAFHFDSVVLSNFSGVNNLQNTAAIVRDITNEGNKKIKIEPEESKDIENKLITNCSETRAVKCEDQVKRNTEPVEVIQFENEIPGVRCKEVDLSGLKLKKELLDVCENECKTFEVKGEVEVTKVQIKREPVEVIEID